MSRARRHKRKRNRQGRTRHFALVRGAEAVFALHRAAMAGTPEALDQAKAEIRTFTRCLRDLGYLEIINEATF